MPALGPLLAWFASYLISSLIFRLFVSTGLSIISFYFVNELVTTAKDQVQNAFFGLPSYMLAFIQLYKFDQAISVVLSAYAIAAYIKTARVVIGRSG
ncbi:DUF2523 domain-containing protein [Acinetobacter pittii]|uniref:DUF2523 domain-containing protein n=1 Tax=Acinetobacter pittii TaxID=48296 RepID=UPI00197DEADB|nr:DUF2523 domain-containing protein [Acinetobacter pittii]MBN6522673.1 DUF2523 domain-containing protein [Acinetobacter pittii]